MLIQLSLIIKTGFVRGFGEVDFSSVPRTICFCTLRCHTVNLMVTVCLFVCG